MQPTENFSVPRRALDVEDFIDIGRRHKGWIFGPFLLTLVASVVGVYLWPDSYDSVATVKIVPQQVSQNMVQSAVTNDMSDQINSMTTTVLSRNALTLIINNFDLYKSERKRLPMDDVVENVMHPNLHIEPILVPGSGSTRTVPAFTVRFTYPDRFLANKVVADIVNRFISQNKTERTAVNTESTQFFQDQAEQAKKELAALENKLADFKAQNNGRLPDQVDLNYRNLTTLQTNYQNLTGAKSRAELDKLSLETNLGIEKSHKKELSLEVVQPAVQPVAMKSERMLDAEREVRTLEEGLAALRQRYTEKNQDVQTVKDRLEAAKQRKADLQKEEAEAKPSVAAATPPVNRQAKMAELEVDGNIQRYESAIESKKLEIADYDRQIKATQASIDKLQAQIAAAPLGEQQYGDLLRERDMAKTKYMELDAHLSKAEISKDLESSGQGEKLEILDAASLPQNPAQPKRPLIIGMGAALGLLLGVVIAAAREVKDTSLKNLKDVRAYTQMAILGSVPLLENDFVVRRRKRIAWLGWTTASLMAALTMAGSVVFYYYNKG